jgi:hypothetical protein
LNVTLVLAGAATLGLILVALVLYPSAYAYYIYPQTQSTSMILSQDYGYTYGSETPYFNESNYHHITESELKQFPQIQEILTHFVNSRSTHDLTDSYSYSSISCERPPNDIFYFCKGIVSLKVSEVGNVGDTLGIGKYPSDGIEYNGIHYRAFLPDAGLKSVYNDSILYGIIVSIVGSLAIWLWVARVEGRRSRGQHEEKVT